MKIECTNLPLQTISAFWSSSRWPKATKMSSRRQRSIPVGGRYRQVSLYHYHHNCYRRLICHIPCRGGSRIIAGENATKAGIAGSTSAAAPRTTVVEKCLVMHPARRRNKWTAFSSKSILYLSIKFDSVPLCLVTVTLYEHDIVSNHWHIDCLLSCPFRQTTEGQ